MPPDVSLLVVDDEPLIRWSLSEALGDHGFEVTVAGDGRALSKRLATDRCPMSCCSTTSCPTRTA